MVRYSSRKRRTIAREPRQDLCHRSEQSNWFFFFWLIASFIATTSTLWMHSTTSFLSYCFSVYGAGGYGGVYYQHCSATALDKRGIGSLCPNSSTLPDQNAIASGVTNFDTALTLYSVFSGAGLDCAQGIDGASEIWRQRQSWHRIITSQIGDTFLRVLLVRGGSHVIHTGQLGLVVTTEEILTATVAPEGRDQSSSSSEDIRSIRREMIAWRLGKNFFGMMGATLLRSIRFV